MFSNIQIRKSLFQLLWTISLFLHLKMNHLMLYISADCFQCAAALYFFKMIVLFFNIPGRGDLFSSSLLLIDHNLTQCFTD